MWEHSRTELRRRTHAHHWGTVRCVLLRLLPRQVIVRRPDVWPGLSALCHTEETRWQMQTLPGNTGVSGKLKHYAWWKHTCGTQCCSLRGEEKNGQSDSQSTNQSINKSVIQTVSHSVSQTETLRRSVSQSVSRSVRHSVRHSVRNSVSQSDCPSVS